MINRALIDQHSIQICKNKKRLSQQSVFSKRLVDLATCYCGDKQTRSPVSDKGKE